MGAVRVRWMMLALACLLPSAGCQLVPRNRLTACETQSRALSEQNKAQLAEIANLKAHSRTVEDRLIKAEEELALVQERSGLDRQRLSNFQSERDQLGQKLDGLFHTASHRTGQVDPRLRDLCQRYTGLKLDAKSGLCKVDEDILFESGEASLSADARRQLNDLVEMLKSPDGRQLRVMLVGHTDNRPVGRRDTRARYPDNWHLSAARALNVAEYLEHAGLKEDQVGIAGYGRHQPVEPNAAAAARQRNRRVEIFVLGPETPIVGWTETSASLYR